MLLFRLSDLNENLRRQAEEQLTRRERGTGAAAAPQPKRADGEGKCLQKANGLKLEPYSPKTVAKPPMRDSRSTPNKTELDYNARVLQGKGRFEPVILRTPGGNYTPDWMTIDDGVVTFHECKGAYRLPSESRAAIGFAAAAAAFPFWRFVWAQKQKGGRWVVKKLIPPSPISIQKESV